VWLPLYMGARHHRHCMRLPGLIPGSWVVRLCTHPGMLETTRLSSSTICLLDNLQGRTGPIMNGVCYLHVKLNDRGSRSIARCMQTGFFFLSLVVLAARLGSALSLASSEARNDISEGRDG
jgi:hypothetical protein